MIGDPLTPNLHELRVAWALLMICRNDSRFIEYSCEGQAEAIRFFRYLDHEPTGADVSRARNLLGEPQCE